MADENAGSIFADPRDCWFFLTPAYRQLGHRRYKISAFLLVENEKWGNYIENFVHQLLGRVHTVVDHTPATGNYWIIAVFEPIRTWFQRITKLTESNGNVDRTGN